VVGVPAVRSAATVVAGTRPLMFLVGYLAVLTIGPAGGRAPLRYFDNELLNLPVRWDASWYLEIANQGYRFRTEPAATAAEYRLPAGVPPAGANGRAASSATSSPASPSRVCSYRWRRSLPH